MRSLPALVLVALATLRAAAQPGEIPAELVFDSIKHAYRDAPYAERAMIVIRRPATTPERSDRPTERREEVTLRVDPGRGLERTGAKVCLELGELRVAAGDGKVTIIHARDPGNYVQTQYAGPLTPAVLAAALPPLPLPQLDLSLGAADPPTRLTPYAEAIIWLAATADDQAAPTTVTISGQSAGRKVEAVTDASGRLREFRAELPAAASPPTAGAAQSAAAPASQLRIQITREPIAADATWNISTEGRTKVSSLSQLRPRP